MEYAKFTTDVEGLKKIIDFLSSSDNKTLEDNNRQGRDVYILTNAEAIYNMTANSIVDSYKITIESKTNKPTELHVEGLTDLIKEVCK